jgi:SAM-dependent methyltransferase
VVKANYRYKEGEAAREASRLLQSFDFDELKHPEYDAELVLVTDCGYGAFALMLSFLKPDAKIIALDKDNFKVQLATHAYLKGTHLKFLTWDEFETHSKWFDLICAQNYRPDWNEKLLPILNPEGKLLIFTDDGEDMLKQVAREQGLYYFKNKYFQGIRKQH